MTQASGLRHSPKYEVLAATIPCPRYRISWTLGRAAPWMFHTPQLLRNTRSRTDGARGDDTAHTNKYEGSTAPVRCSSRSSTTQTSTTPSAAYETEPLPIVCRTRRLGQDGPHHRRSGERRACRAIPSVPAFSPSITARETADKRPLIIASIIAHQKHLVLVFLPEWQEEGDREAAPEDPHKDKGALCSASWDNRGQPACRWRQPLPLKGPALRVLVLTHLSPQPPPPPTTKYAGYVPFHARLCTTTTSPRPDLANHLEVQRASTGSTHQGAPLYPPLPTSSHILHSVDVPGRPSVKHVRLSPSLTIFAVADTRLR